MKTLEIKNNRDLTFIQFLVLKIGVGRMWKIVIGLLIFLVFLPVITHYYISKITENYESDDNRLSTAILDSDVKIQMVNGIESRFDIDKNELTHRFMELKNRISELEKIKASVSNELKNLELKRHRLHADISGFSSNIDKLKFDYKEKLKKLDILRQNIDNTRLEREEIVRRNLPEIQPPLEPLLKSFISLQSNSFGINDKLRRNCRMYNCFDYSRCSIFSKFPVFAYSESVTKENIHPFIKNAFHQILNKTIYLTKNGETACIYLVLVGDVEAQSVDASVLSQLLKRLKYWNKSGTNHILINFSRHYNVGNIFRNVDTGQALLVHTGFYQDFRPDFDFVIPPVFVSVLSDDWDTLPFLSPAKRKYLLSFHGDFPSSNAKYTILYEKKIIAELKKLEINFPDLKFSFSFSCSNNNENVIGKDGLEWSLCSSDLQRFQKLKDSTFSLIFSPINDSLSSTTIFQTRITESLKSGAIPVIVGGGYVLPFTELVDWKKFSVRLSRGRINELHYIIRSIPDVDLLEMRRQCRHVWITYFSSFRNIFDSLLLIMRKRLNIPSFPVSDTMADVVYNSSIKPIFDDNIDEEDESIGLVELPLVSKQFNNNFSMYDTLFGQQIDIDPYRLYPYLPWRNFLPGEAEFLGSSIGFRPINAGLGGAGKEFSQALGGNIPREQFTVILLTYQRQDILIEALKRLKLVAHLNKVIVVWNSQSLPSIDFKWPQIGVPIVVIKTSKNSLNNRFIPYDAIETEAILSIDDDAHLRPDEIDFAFRVWREARDRIVGFPGRFHSWDAKTNSWLYNSNYSCELSMVLTGAAFFHKYYSYVYNQVMPASIRNKVDEFMNCEDLAMNFLVSHITRKPPIKVTSRWTFRCPGCPSTLSEEDSHFQERHKCMNFLTSIYGYMPLLRTQFRADSVLFKTRIPHDREKCYKYV